MFDSLSQLVTESGFAGFFSNPDGWRNLVMILIACVLLYLGIKKQYEPLLMVGIAMGCLLANVSSVFMTTDGSLPDALYHQSLWDAFLDQTSPYYHDYGHILATGGLIDILYIGVKAGQTVKSGEVLAVLEAMKMENEIMAPHDATVVQILADVGTKVDTGTPIIVLG